MSTEEANLQFLEKPEIEEALSGELDWHALNGKNFNVIIKNLPSDAVDKELKLTWLGTTSDEEELDPEHKSISYNGLTSSTVSRSNWKMISQKL